MSFGPTGLSGFGSKRRSAAGGAFTPASLTDSIWFDGSDVDTMWSDDVRATPIADAVGVQEWQAKGGAASPLALINATSGQRPVWNEAGGYLQFTSGNSSNLENTSQNLFGLSSSSMGQIDHSIYVLADCPFSGWSFLGVDRSSTVGTHIAPLRISGTTYQPWHAIGGIGSSGTSLTSAVTANTLSVFGVEVDDSTDDYIFYDETTPSSALAQNTPGGTASCDNFVLGCWWVYPSAKTYFFTGKIYQYVAVPYLLTTDERSDLVTWLKDVGGL